jgi:lysophospholipase L1-like esterase
MQVFLFGDSITYGMWDTKGGWAGRLREYLDQRALTNSTPEGLNTTDYVTCYNCGIPGEMSTGLAARIRSEFESRYNQEQENILVIAIGINDTHYNFESDSIGVSKEEYLQNLKQMLQFAKGYSQKILFVGLTPVDEERCHPLFWQSQNSYSNELIKEYDQALKDFCQKEEVPLVEIYDRFINMDYPRLMEDGIHPNGEGHQMMFEAIKDFLEKQKFI